MRPLSLSVRAIKELGLRPVMEYGLYQAGLRSGWLRWKTPSYSWGERPLSTWLRDGVPQSHESFHRYRREDAGRFLFQVDAGFKSRLRDVLQGREGLLIAEADDVLRGVFSLFGLARVKLGFPPDWSRAPSKLDGESSTHWDLERHWTATELHDNPGDIKLLWEPARFSWLYTLARAFVLTEDVRYQRAGWALIESWRAANAPNTGPHWSSGQEAALRIFALLFAEAAFGSDWYEKPEREMQLAEMLAAHAIRIPTTLLYAKAQGNNHLLVEAAALYSVGLLFPMYKEAQRWRKLGRRWLVQAMEDQVFDDGGYVQHSFNYHRLALQVGLWAARLAELNADPLPQAALDQLRRMTELLMAFVLPENGRVPNHGPNDGAHIFPWSTCEFHDHRPTVQVGSQALSGTPAYPFGPWDEACLWYGLLGEARSQPARQATQGSNGAAYLERASVRISFPDAGLHLMIGGRARGLLRCCAFETRPGHSDQLHFGLWWDDRPIALDAGTYRYQAEPPWDNALAAAAVHNTLVVDGEDPMRRAGRFLWLDWAQGRLLGRWRSRDGSLEIVAAEHNGYRRWGLTHRRSVVRAGDGLWLVVDDLIGSGIHEARVGWLVQNGRWEWSGCTLKVAYDAVTLALNVMAEPARYGLYLAGERVAGDVLEGESPCWGWHAPTYALKEPALRLVSSVEGNLPMRICTWWAFNGAKPDELDVAWREVGSGRGPIEWAAWNDEKLSIADAYFVDSSSVRSAG